MIEQNKRDRPKGYIDRALDMLFERKRNNLYSLDILEVGSMRGYLTHHVDITTYECCNDGHSTFLFARTGWDVLSVNICEEHLNAAKDACRNFKNINYLCEDAMETASRFIGSVGLLFLDAWDLDVPGSPERHLEFYDRIVSKLTNRPMILIDDTDLYYDFSKKEYFPDKECLSGKGKYLIPKLKAIGYNVIFKGRQTLLA